MRWLWYLVFQLTLTLGVLSTSSTFNAALMKDANQSSVYATFSSADKAVDGNNSPAWAKRSCASTAHHDFNPWWQVDLGRDLQVTAVLVTNRLNDLGRLHDFSVTVFSDDASPGKVCGIYQGAVPSAATVKVACDQIAWGRYVKITKPTKHHSDILTLCEVQVMAMDVARKVFERQIGKTAESDPTVALATDLPTCAHSCKDSNCLAIQYNRNTEQCRLYNSTNITDAIVNSMWELYMIRL